MVKLKDSKPTSSNLMTDQDFLLGEKLTIQQDPFILVGASYLFIKTKFGEMKRFKLNSVQQYVFKKIIELRKQKKPARLWILKFRQGGISTLTEALIYALTSQQENRNSLIMGDEEDKSEYLFQMSKLYHENMLEKEPHLTPEKKKSNAKTLEFKDTHSQIIIETGRNINATRAFTYQYVHLSEVATFPNLKGVLTGLMQSVPQHWDTFVVGETTANGMNAFYHEWKRAIEGKSDWIPMFLPWYWMEEYARELQDGEFYSIEGVTFTADYSKRQFMEDEKLLKKDLELTDEQINWRRWCIVNNCQGDINTFRQEYPATWEESFIMSGDCYFDTHGLNKQIVRVPKRIGEIYNENMKWEFRNLEYGRIKLYYEPTHSDTYIVSADASEGIPGKDTASVLVLNKRLNRVEATVNGPITPEELATLSIALAEYYNGAIFAGENKHYGYMLNRHVYAQYGNIYRKITNKDGTNVQSEELGWNTNSVTRPQMLAQMNEEIKRNSTSLTCQDLIEECRSFVVDPDTKKAEGADGCQDGLVICRAIAGMVRIQHPHVEIDPAMESFHSGEQVRGNYGFSNRRKR